MHKLLLSVSLSCVVLLTGVTNAATPDWLAIEAGELQDRSANHRQVEALLVEFERAGDTANTVRAMRHLLLAEQNYELKSKLKSRLPVAEALYAKTQVPALGAVMYMVEGQQLEEAGKLDRVEALLRQAHSLAVTSGDPTLIAISRGELAVWHMSEGAQPEQSIEDIEDLERLLPQIHGKKGRVDALRLLAYYRLQQNNFDAHQVLWKQVQSTLDPEKDHFGMALATMQLAKNMMSRGKFQEASPLFDKALHGFKALNDLLASAYTTQLWAASQLELKQFAEAEQLAQASAQLFQQTGDHEFNAHSSMLLQARALVNLKRNDEAARLLETVREVGLKNPQPSQAAQINQQASKLYESMGRWEDAYRSLITFMETVDKQVAQSDKIGVQLREANVRVRQQQDALRQAFKEQEHSKRTIMILGLLLSAAVIGSLMVILVLQVRARRNYADLALRDELTGAPNRRSIMARARKQLLESQQSGEPLCLAILDLDHFKAINDTFGHEMGDLALVRFYETVSGCLRASDAIGRIGGEEWLLVLAKTDPLQCRALFTRMREHVSAIRLPAPADKVKISFSMGVTPVSNEDRQVDMVLRRADDALYQAKDGGRDRVEVNDPVEPGEVLQPD
ncbi:diguanylate cyclase [Burkholderiaceae bacterium DAT-1]|nr:diguanylate cyclase [Burkholderiaceae bacterium DAT-1]